MFAIAVIVVCSALSGCGTNSDAVKSNANEKDPVFSNNNSEGDIVGADWRTTGIIIDYGIITRNGKNVDVVVTLDNEGAFFYYDSSNKKLFESVSFPFSVTDSWDAYNAVYFDDVNSDGESDVTLHFHHDDYTFTQLVWCWDNNGYVYREELSSLRDEPVWVNKME